MKRDAHEKVVLQFKDYGQGIENPEKILEGYYRENDLKNGFGIGMRIVKSIIDEEGVRLTIVSQPGKGSIFRYVFTPLYIG
ncbi:Alginate biosynthesis sensor protein KinB [compost metagenome]